MLLNDVMIKQLVEKDPTFIQPFEGRKVSDGELPSWGLEPHGYTFRLATYFPFPLLPTIS
jgi:hypothetical protein